MYDQIQAAKNYIQNKTSLTPHIGIILGSGLGAFAERLKQPVTIPYSDIPHFPQSSVEGHAGELWLGELHGVACAIMRGRVHFYEGYDLPQVTFPVRVLAALGVTQLVVTNAAGGVNPAFAPGDFMLIQDHLNLTGHNPLCGHNDERLGPRFPDMTYAYSVGLRSHVQQAAKTCGLILHEGVYAGLSGPSYETPAEIRMLQRLGADAVGMSTVAEVIVARHSGIEVCGISVITNRAAGLSSGPLSHEEVKEVGDRVRGPLCDLLEGSIARLKLPLP